jgi:hypothetical protein
MLQQCLRAELKGVGIAVGIAKPGAVDTDLLRIARDAHEDVGGRVQRAGLGSSKGRTPRLSYVAPEDEEVALSRR